MRWQVDNTHPQFQSYSKQLSLFLLIVHCQAGEQLQHQTIFILYTVTLKLNKYLKKEAMIDMTKSFAVRGTLKVKLNYRKSNRDETNFVNKQQKN